MDDITQAFDSAKRENFVPEYLRGSVNIDAPLPIGHGQTISQPTTVELMLRWLDSKPGDKVLDVGSGSGWTAALLSHIAGPKGKVYAVEKVPELVEFGRENVHRLGIKNVEFHQAGPEFGLPEFAPYDRILVSAAAEELPTELIKQLGEGGKMVIPVQNDILEIEKKEGSVNTRSHSGFVFVPLLD